MDTSKNSAPESSNNSPLHDSKQRRDDKKSLLTDRFEAHFLASKRGQIDWQWVFIANLTIETPLAILGRHADVIDPKNMRSLGDVDPMMLAGAKPAMNSDELAYGEWVISEKIGDDSGASSNVIVMDIPESACSPSRYLAFLTRFRSIIESDDRTSKKRKRLQQWFDEETWSDVLVWWHGEEEFINRVVPTFLDHLVEQKIPKKVTDQLDILGIDNRLALTRLIHGKLGVDLQTDIEGCSKKTAETLNTFCIRDQLMDLVEGRSEDACEEDRKNLTQQLEDPFIQIIY